MLSELSPGLDLLPPHLSSCLYSFLLPHELSLAHERLTSELISGLNIGPKEGSGGFFVRLTSERTLSEYSVPLEGSFLSQDSSEWLGL